MSKTLDYIADLERENRLVKSFLYCTKRSCNNCGKVNCENFQRQRIDCCGLWVSYKDYIKQQEDKIADIKANCDLAIEGRDIKIQELEKEVKYQTEDGKKWQNMYKQRCEECQELEKQVKDLEWQLQEVVKDNDNYQTENKRLEQQIEKMKCGLSEVKANYDKAKDKTPIKMCGAEYRLFCDIERLLEEWDKE